MKIDMQLALKISRFLSWAQSVNAPAESYGVMLDAYLAGAREAKCESR